MVHLSPSREPLGESTLELSHDRFLLQTFHLITHDHPYKLCSSLELLTARLNTLQT
jgi:hypothetical protein